MVIHRRFLLASSLARLIWKERDGEQVGEGYFPDQPHRSTSVQTRDDAGSLIILIRTPSGEIEERATLPAAHAEALLAVTAGQVAYLQARLFAADREIYVFRFITPGPLDFVLMPFMQEEEAREFQPLSWFGPEVSTDPAYHHRRIALSGLPESVDVEITGGALHALLDVLEERFSPEQPMHDTGVPEAQTPFLKEPHASDEADDDADAEIEDDVIRELARSLRPRRN